MLLAACSLPGATAAEMGLHAELSMSTSASKPTCERGASARVLAPATLRVTQGGSGGFGNDAPTPSMSYNQRT